jgi:uncharacterized protein (DUF2336 family)
MNSIEALVRDVEHAVGGHDEVKRVRMLRSVTELFFAEADRLAEDQVGVFDEVIVRLAEEIDRLARIDLARRIGSTDKGPRKTIRSLALDRDPDVAAPVLERSPLLYQEDLLTVIAERGPEHRAAVARRADLPPAITDALIRRGEAPVLATLLRNRSAQISPAGMRLLARDGSAARETDESGTSALTRRRRETPDEMAAAVNRAAEHIRSLAASGRLDEPAILALLRGGRTAEALAGVALLSEMPPSLILRAYGAPQPDPLMFIARALGFGWPTLEALLETKGAPVGTLEMQAVRSSFDLLTVATSQRVLRFVALRAKQERPTALSA